MKKLAQRLARKILRGIVTLIYDDAGIQVLQIKTLNEDLHQVPRVQEYGFTSVPHAGAEAMLVMINDSDGLIVSVDDRRYRLRGLENGEVALYDDQGTKIHLQRGGKIHATAGTQITFETPLMHVTGRIEADGNIKDHAQSIGHTMKAMRDLHDTHTHNEKDNRGPTNVPNQTFT